MRTCVCVSLYSCRLEAFKRYSCTLNLSWIRTFPLFCFALVCFIFTQNTKADPFSFDCMAWHGTTHFNTVIYLSITLDPVNIFRPSELNRLASFSCTGNPWFLVFRSSIRRYVKKWKSFQVDWTEWSGIYCMV